MLDQAAAEVLPPESAVVVRQMNADPVRIAIFLHSTESGTESERYLQFQIYGLIEQQTALKFQSF